MMGIPDLGQIAKEMREMTDAFAGDLSAIRTELTAIRELMQREQSGQRGERNLALATDLS